jgi:single-stranded-DNA-specific exonuclease
MTLGIKCLMAGSMDDARSGAAELDALNTERRVLQERMQGEANDLLAGLSATAQSLGDAHCLFDESWHPGIVGLVASRVRELTGEPAIAFARAGEPGMLRGSARSVEGIHVRDLIANALSRVTLPGVRFGGHAMAAGLTIPEVQLPAFRSALVRELGQFRDSLAASGIVWTDGGLEPGELHIDMAEELAAAGPWGQGFPEPLFDNVFAVRDQRVVGERHLKLRVQHPGGGPTIDAIAFGRGPMADSLDQSARLLYRLDINHYRNSRTAQLVVEHLDCV